MDRKANLKSKTLYPLYKIVKIYSVYPCLLKGKICTSREDKGVKSGLSTLKSLDLPLKSTLKERIYSP